MKKLLTGNGWSIVLIVAAMMAVLVMLSGCGAASPETIEAADAVTSQWIEATADGVVTPEEAAEHAALVDVAWASLQADASSFDWKQTLGEVIGAASVAFVGVNVFRNRAQGKGFITPRVSQ